MASSQPFNTDGMSNSTLVIYNHNSLARARETGGNLLHHLLVEDCRILIATDNIPEDFNLPDENRQGYDAILYVSSIDEGREILEAMISSDIDGTQAESDTWYIHDGEILANVDIDGNEQLGEIPTCTFPMEDIDLTLRQL